MGDYLLTRRRAAEAAGVPSWNIILDPGIGFAKTLEHNLSLGPLLDFFSARQFLGMSGVNFINTYSTLQMLESFRVSRHFTLSRYLSPEPPNLLEAFRAMKTRKTNTSKRTFCSFHVMPLDSDRL